MTRIRRKLLCRQLADIDMEPAAPERRQEAILEQAVLLLQGPTDERRFVGLLLASRQLPTDDEKVLRAVHAAAGASFFRRLLLPLRNTQAIPRGPENAGTAARACALGLAVLAGLSQCAELAASKDFVETIPPLIKVVKDGGISPSFEGLTASEPDLEETLGTDTLAVRDALHCLAAIAAASQEGRKIALEQGSLEACTAVLKRSIDAQHLAVRLLLTLSEHISSDGVAMSGWQVVPLVPLLASLLWSEGNAAAAAQGPPDDPADHALVQLNVVHLLLLLLPITEAAEAELVAMADGGAADWMADARAGLQLMLSARLDPIQRQAGLLLTAALLQYASPSWLLGSGDHSFFVLLVELLRVELALMLHDAAGPDPGATGPEEGNGLQSPGTNSGRRDAARAKAMQTLPPLLLLFEALVQLLAESEDDDRPPVASNKPPRLPDSVAERAMQSLAEVAEVLLQYLEERQTLTGEGSDDTLAIAVTRALSRFLLELPDFKSSRVQPLLPWLARVQAGAGLPYLLPVLHRMVDSEASESRNTSTALDEDELREPIAGYAARLAEEADFGGSMYHAISLMLAFAEHRSTGNNKQKMFQLQQAACKACQGALDCLSQSRATEGRHRKNASLEPRLLSCIGVLAARGLEARGPSAADSASQQLFSKTMLAAMEVSDVLLSLESQEATSSEPGLPDLASLGIGETQADMDDLVKEVRSQQTAMLQSACTLLASCEAFKQAVLSSAWCAAMLRDTTDPRTHSSYDRALRAFHAALLSSSRSRAQ